ncbi:transcription termination factor 3, mitochondrial-like isoform X2 [Physella acuta]|uniref:transcription termination factor 3, mitochondrial-like isoform X2 n=1 Tax=Physella acuta TaxID=109671 RepID=UPI0027DD6582|nr:transcription termination factor 3, mitochondrial-like isoform X2 [Physella acuta]
MASLFKSSFHNNLTLFCVSRCQQHIFDFQKLLPRCTKKQFIHTCTGTHSPEEYPQTAGIEKSLCSSLGLKVKYVCGHCKTMHSGFSDDKTFVFSSSRIDDGLRKISHKSLSSLRGFLDFHKSCNYLQKQSIVGNFFIRSYRGQHRLSTVESTDRAGKGLEFAAHDNMSEEKDVSYNMSVPAWSDVKEEDFAKIFQEEGVYGLQHDPNDKVVKKVSVDDLSLPELSRSAFNIVPYVARSKTLQNLVKIGVNLDKVQKHKRIAELLIKANFDKDILPMLRFLAFMGIPKESMGDVFTKNPLLFKENVSDLELRVGYLIHKKFKLEEVVKMVVHCPILLLMNSYRMDEKFAFLQNAFQLTDAELRKVSIDFPKILVWRKELIADVRFHIKEFLGFTDYELKQILLTCPRLYLSDKNQLFKTFDYLHNTMQISHRQLLMWPDILDTRLFIIKNRHLFLVSLNRDQYNPRLENFVPLAVLGSLPDEEFCRKWAKSTVEEFYNFCKTI